MVITDMIALHWKNMVVCAKTSLELKGFNDYSRPVNDRLRLDQDTRIQCKFDGRILIERKRQKTVSVTSDGKLASSPPSSNLPE